jgi:hypothetical protein
VLLTEKLLVAFSAYVGVGFNFCYTSRYSEENVLFCPMIDLAKYVTVVKFSNGRVKNI